MGKQLERTIFETSRASEYFNVKELQAQTGQPSSNFVTVAFKELMDNALDAAETAGVAPEISVDTVEAGDTVGFSIKDNGGGIKPETVKKILNFDTRTSDKTVYRSPTRGAQGNALKTVIGMPHALGNDGPVKIESCGVRHLIHIWTDPAGELRINHDEEKCADEGGARITVEFPTQDQNYDFHGWAMAYSLYNPHATVRIYHAKSGNDEIKNSYHSTVEFPKGWRKYLPTDLTSPWWYTVEDMERLVFSHIGEARRNGNNLTLRDFVRQFKGLSGTAKAKKVCDRFSEIKRLIDFDDKREMVSDLLKAMQSEVKAPSPNTLGLVGEDHFKKCFADWFGVESMVYKKIMRDLNGIPWVFEVALAEELSQYSETEPDTKKSFYGINFSPSYEDPLAKTTLQCHEYAVTGITNFMRQALALGKPIAVHMVFPF